MVKRKNAHSAATVSSVTTRVPTSCLEIATLPISHDSFGNGLSNAFTSAPQIQPVRPFRAISRPIVTITIAISGRCSTGRISVRSMAAPPRNERASVSTNAGQ